MAKTKESVEAVAEKAEIQATLIAEEKEAKEGTETLTEEINEEKQYVVENPDLSSDLETIVPVELEYKGEFEEITSNNENGKKQENNLKKIPVKAILVREKVITEASDDARELYNQSRFGSITDNGKVALSLLEALFLFEKKRLNLQSEAGRKITFEAFVKKARKVEPNFWNRYCVFKDIRNRGYIIKTALKFGADFRVYDRGVKPGEDHARWIVYPVHEGETLTWYEFAAKNRVAHSTKKRLLIGIVDDEGDVTYYEIRWLRP